MSQADAPAADWYPDPSGRFQFRYWDGESWTGHVSTDGNTDWDPPEEAAADVQQSGDAAAGHEGAAQEGGEQAPAAQHGADQEGGGQPESAGQPAATSVPPDEPEPTGDDSAYAPGGQGQTSEPASDQQPSEGLSGQTVRIDQAQLPATTPPESSADAPPQTAQPQETQPQGAAASGAAQGGTIEEGEPSDTNLVANQRADVDDDVKAWLDEVAAQVSPRLSRINREWTSQPQAEAARACAYGLLVGHLAHLHPHMRDDLSKVAEAHPSFTTLEDGARLDTLEQIARDPQRTAAWLGPLIATEDADRVQTLFD